MKCNICNEEAMVRIRDIIVIYNEGAYPKRIVPDGNIIPLCDNHKRESRTVYVEIFLVE